MEFTGIVFHISGMGFLETECLLGYIVVGFREEGWRQRVLFTFLFSRIPQRQRDLLGGRQFLFARLARGIEGNGIVI
jgi:hypothetical protein